MIAPQYQDMSATPISIPSHSIKTHLFNKRKNAGTEFYHPLDFADSEESEADQSTICDSECDECDDISFPNSLGSYTSSSVSSSLSTSLTSHSSSFTGSFLSPSKKSSLSSVSPVHATSVSVPVAAVSHKTSSSSNLVKILESSPEAELSGLPQTAHDLHSLSAAASSAAADHVSIAGSSISYLSSYSKIILQTYLKIDLLPDFFGRSGGPKKSDKSDAVATTSAAAAAAAECGAAPEPSFVDSFADTSSSSSLLDGGEELQCFSNSTAVAAGPQDTLFKSKPTRNRELRINSRFLIMYSFDYNSRANGLLPNACTTKELEDLLQSSAMRKFHKQHNLNRISVLSRDKLWENVILQARNDPLPSTSIEYENYIKNDEDEDNDDDEDEAESDFDTQRKLRRQSSLSSSLSRSFSSSFTQRARKHSLVKLNGCEYLPWLNMTKQSESVKPAGILKGGKALCNGESPSSGLTRTQFTVKGWTNKRWVSTS